MRRFLCVGVVLLAGCAGPRFLEVDSGGAVLAMPDNTNSWPNYHRDNADKMLKSRFPSGYTIVKEEEVVVGVSSHTSGQTNTERAPSMMVGASSKPGGFAGVAVPLGPTRQQHEESTSYHAQTEWRLVVRANGPGGSPSVAAAPNSMMPVNLPNPTGPVIQTGAVGP